MGKRPRLTVYGPEHLFRRHAIAGVRPDGDGPGAGVQNIGCDLGRSPGIAGIVDSHVVAFTAKQAGAGSTDATAVTVMRTIFGTGWGSVAAWAECL